jgi:hypothetical protein
MASRAKITAAAVQHADPRRAAGDRHMVEHDVSGDPENRAVAKRHASGEAGEKIDRHCERGEDQHLDDEARLVAGDHERHGRQQRQAGERDASPCWRRHCAGGLHAARPNKPSGRNASNSAIGPKITK